PAALAGHGPAAHGLEAGVEVLEHPGPDVVEAGPAVGGRRALVEDPRLAVLAPGLRLRGHVVLGPAREDALLPRDQVEVGVDGSESHRPSLREHALPAAASWVS